MITTHSFRKRKWKFVLLFPAFATILFLSRFLEGAYGSYAPRENELKLTQEVNLPLREISGLYLDHHSPDGELKTMYSIGDKYAQLGRSKVDFTTGKIVENEVIDFTASIVNQFALCSSNRVPSCKNHSDDLTSQWEGIAADGAGNLFLLHEQFATVFVYAVKQNKFLSAINLESFTLSEKKNRKRAGEKHLNALGEGIIPLKNGHFLVIKERGRASIIEFGPEGEEAEGFDPALGYFPGEEHQVKNFKESYRPLHIWTLPKTYKSCDMSEINQDENGNLYLLSQQCQWIAKVDKLSPRFGKVHFNGYWSIPRKIQNAESFVVVEDSKRFVVAEDKKSTKANNLFFLSVE